MPNIFLYGKFLSKKAAWNMTLPVCSKFLIILFLEIKFIIKLCRFK